MGNILGCLRLLCRRGDYEMSDGYQTEESEKDDTLHGSGSSASHDANSSRKAYVESNAGTERSLMTLELPSRESEKLNDDEETPQPSPSAERPPKLEFPLTPNPMGKNNDSSLQSVGTDTTGFSLRTGDHSVELGDVVYRACSQVSSNNPGNRSSRRWTDEVLEEFLDSTMVEGSGLVLTKLGSGSLKTQGERIMTYNPGTSELLWKSSGVVRKEGGMKAKAIDDVKREGTIVRILYSATAAEGGPRRRGSKSLLRLTKAREQKVFQATAERDAQILQEILLLLRQKERDAEDAIARVNKERGSFGVSPSQNRIDRTQPSV